MRPRHSWPATSDLVGKLDWSWIHTFLVLQFALQGGLLVPLLNDRFRLLLRTGTFALSLILLFYFLWRRGASHPASGLALGVMGILGLQFSLHDSHGSLLAAIAQALMYLAILAPLFWVCRLKVSPRSFETLIYLLWVFHLISAGLGMLQVYFPGQFQMPLVETIIERSTYGGAEYLITLGNGLEIFRPMGLSDSPGGASISGFYALLLSVAIALKNPHWVIRILCCCGAGMGLLVIYLCQLRVNMVLTAMCLMIFALTLLLSGQVGRFLGLTLLTLALLLGGISWVTEIGGEEMLERVRALLEGSPVDVYYENRGFFLEQTLMDYLPQYPLGAGLGRWGMMNHYFAHGDPSSLWAEIMWTGWLFDGGIPMVVTYFLALVMACGTAWNLTRRSHGDGLNYWACWVFAYDLGLCAKTFSAAVFISQVGMEFWLLNAALFMASRYYPPPIGRRIYSPRFPPGQVLPKGRSPSRALPPGPGHNGLAPHAFRPRG